MNKTEVKNLVKQIILAYPNFEIKPDARFKLWCDMLADVPYDRAIDNLKDHIKTNRFAPTIADIRGIPKNQKKFDGFCEVTGRTYELYEPPELN
jgi:hypothetical protein